MSDKIICTHCIEGKALPAIPKKGVDIDKYPDCDYCNGTGEYIKDEGRIREGKRLSDIRVDNRYSLRKFCMNNGLDAVRVSKIERGLIECTQEVKEAYELLEGER